MKRKHIVHQGRVRNPFAQYLTWDNGSDFYAGSSMYESGEAEG